MEPKKQLLTRIQGWLETQGYPLEFKVAAAFQAAGMATRQGFFVREVNGQSAREVDVIARIRSKTENSNVSVTFVVECKWSRDKPWVIFTDANTKMAPSACIAQTIGSRLGEAALHCLAANKSLHGLESFAMRDRNGFNGRRAFSSESDQDHFYSTVQSIVSKSVAYVTEADDGEDKIIPQYGTIAFPLIVLDGDLFEVFFDSSQNALTITPADFIRMHWRGASNPDIWIATVDIVTATYLDTFVAKRKAELEILGSRVAQLYPKFSACLKSKSLSPLDIKPAPRGYTGLPEMLQRIDRLKKKE